MNRRELLTKVIPVGIGAGIVLPVISGCGSKKKAAETEQNKQEEEQYYKQEGEKAKSDEANEQ